MWDFVTKKPHVGAAPHHIPLCGIFCIQFICDGNQQLKRSGANGFQTGKEMSSFLLDKPSVGDTIEIRQLSTGVTVTGVQHSKD